MTGTARLIRDRIAQALTAGGAAGQPYPPDNPNPPMAWPERRETTQVAAGLQITWDVVLVVPTMQSTEDIEDLVDGLADSLSDVGVVTSWQPDSIRVGPSPDGGALAAIYRFQLSTLY